VVVASNGGSPTHPAWYRNLKANASVDVEVGAETFPVVAEELDETARAELWPQLAAQAPQIDDHQAKVTDRSR
jgi:deazaflavin-dependent oxidoreductase (nitroreductase family)